MKPRENMGRVWQWLANEIVQRIGYTTGVDLVEGIRAGLEAGIVIGWEEERTRGLPVFLSYRRGWRCAQLVARHRAGRAGRNMLVWHGGRTLRCCLGANGIEREGRTQRTD